MNRKHWSLILTVVMMLGLLPTAVMAQSPNYYTSVIVSDITSGAAVVGSVFTTDVSLSIVNNASPQQGFMGADVWISFDPAVLGVDDADDNPANGIQVDISTEFFGGSVFVAANEVVTCPSGMCVHLALSHSGSPITNRTGKIATITWAVLETVTLPAFAGLGVDADTVLSDINGVEFPINSTSVPAIAISAPGILSGTVLRQGMDTDEHAGSDIIAYNSGGGVIGMAVTDAWGNFELIVPMGGSYLIQAWYPGYLKAQKSSVYVVGATVNLGTVTLPGGDVNSDNNINILDIVTIIHMYGTAGTDPADINDDGIVNIFDLTIAAGNFGTYGPLGW